MISRRHFLRFAGGLGAAGVSTVAYGFGEPRCGFASRATTSSRRNGRPISSSGSPSSPTFTPAIPGCRWIASSRSSSAPMRSSADIIVLLGDYVAGHRQVTRFIPASEWAPVLAGLKAPLGVHAILGNHDWWEDKTVQRDGQGTDDRPARARSRRHSGLRKRRGAADQGRPAVLARRARRSTGLSAGAALPAGPAHRRRRSRRDARRK